MDIPEDPILAQRPPFLYSLLTQVCVESVAFTTAFVLLCLCLFTYHYHIPLSKINFFFQVTACTVYIIGSVVWLYLVLRFESNRAKRWPYMFDYAELILPLEHWGTGKRAAFLFTEGLNALLVHGTHIQCLTLLFPSSVERRLILITLGPLALASAGCQFMDLAQSDVVQDLGDAIRAVCNSTLVMLYTAALLIYGIAINRSRAWRKEGGTASFGVLAIGIGITTSAIIFIEIKEDRLTWLQHAVWGILLWQSWITFWWFVSTGMYAGEVADRDMREAARLDRKQKKRARRRRRKAGTALPSVALSGTSSDSVLARLSRQLHIDRIPNALPPSLRLRTRSGDTPMEDSDDPLEPLSPTSAQSPAAEEDSATLHRRRRARPSLNSRSNTLDEIELADLPANTTAESESRRQRQQQNQQKLEVSTSGSDASTTDLASSVTNMFARIFLRPAFINRMLNKLSTAHDQAARTKAMELPTINSNMNSRMAGPLGGIGASPHIPEAPIMGPSNRNAWQSSAAGRKIRLKAVDKF